MLTYIILAIVSVIVGVWIFNKANKTETKPETPTVEEEPVGYESGSFASTPVAEQPVVVETPKKKRAPKTPKMDAKPKKSKKTNA